MFWPSTTAALQIALNLQAASAAQTVVDLGSQSWTLTSPDNEDISVPGQVPSQAHIDLYDADIIDDPLYGLNEYEVRWVAFSNWTYSSDITGLEKSEDLTTHIVFDGLDTFAEIKLCGEHIANTDNQFRQYVLDITSALNGCSADDPTLEVKFGAAPNITEAIAAEPGQETWPGGVNQVYQIPNRWFVRKEQNDFGWDWGPAFSPAGIWKPARIVQLSSAAISVANSAFDLYRKGQLNNLPPDQSADWVFNASIDVVGTVPEGASMRYTVLDTDSKAEISSGELSDVENVGDVITGIASLSADDYELWWPAGLGAQKLYNITVDIVLGDTSIASVNKRLGFRTIVLDMSPISEKQLSQGITNGNNWHFQINGHEFYAKGSNIIPPDPFWPRVTDQHLRDIFTSVTDGNQNMLRVWSSGIYAPDYMYDLADELGVLLWCEFEFSVSLYPVAEAFLENVRREAVYQVRRANHHPSLAVWAGGNEMEKDELPQVNRTAPDQYQRYLAEYITLFLDTLLPAVYGNSRSISYMPCSTNNGYLELNHSLPIPFVDRLYNKTDGYLYGDSDFYNYNAAEGFDVDTYVVGRFANEFGFPSMPTLETWREAVPEEELYFNSTTTVLRSRHYPPGGYDTDNLDKPLRGQHEMTVGVTEWYPTPNKEDSIANFSAWCHATQVYQADFYRSKIQYYRAASGLPQRQLGALYWQLNDIWQAPTWSSMEYSGRWKMMFYATKDIFQPVILAPVWNVSSGILDVFAVSDLWSDVSGEASWKWVGYDGEVLDIEGAAESKEFTVGGVNATLVKSMNITSLLENGLPAANAVLLANLTATGTPPNTEATKTYTHANFFTATPLSKAEIVDPGLSLSYSSEDSTFTVSAKTGVSAFTWLAPDPEDEAVIVVFSDNGFWLDKGESRTIGYRIVKGESEGWEGRVGLSSVWNNTLGA